MMQEFGDISQNQKGILRVGTGFTRGRILIPQILPLFQKTWPSIYALSSWKEITMCCPGKTPPGA